MNLQGPCLISWTDWSEYCVYLHISWSVMNVNPKKQVRKISGPQIGVYALIFICIPFRRMFELCSDYYLLPSSQSNFLFIIKDVT
jgi:hypothetical protein